MEAWVAECGLDLGRERDWLLGYASGSPGRLVEAVETGLASWGVGVAHARGRVCSPGVESRAGALTPAVAVRVKPGEQHLHLGVEHADVVQREQREDLARVTVRRVG